MSRPLAERLAGPLRALVGLGLAFYLLLRTIGLDGGADFNRSFYQAARAGLYRDTPLYRPNRIDENPFLLAFRLPPPAALYLAPFALLPLPSARLLWGVVTLLAYLASLVLLCRGFGVRFLSWPWLAALAAWSVFSPAYETLNEGQWNTLFLLLLALATVGAASGRPVLAAVPLAVAASVKPYPLLLALFFVARRWWRALALTVATLGGLFAAGFAFIGRDQTVVYLTRVLPASGPTTATPDNQSLGGLIARLATDDFGAVPLESAAVDLVIRAVAATLMALATYLAWRAPGRGVLDRALQLGLFIPLSVLAIPVAWGHYHTILLIPIFLLAIDLARDRPGAVGAWIVLGLGFFLLALADARLLVGTELTHELWRAHSRSAMDAASEELLRRFSTPLARLLLSCQAIGALLILALTAWRVSAGPARASAPDEPAAAPRGRERSPSAV